MPRKFTQGRQNDATFNQELHDLIMALRYLNNGNSEPIQDKQAPIPSGAIWNDRTNSKNILKAQDNNGNWNPMFEGYYHPANLLVKPLHPTHGQIYIDIEADNTLKRYDQNTGAWITVNAGVSSSNNLLINAQSNFMNMIDMKDNDTDNTKKTFLVPHEVSGKLFDNGSYIHASSEEYTPLNEVSVEYKTADAVANESWIHVNPYKLFNVAKKLILVEGPIILGLSYGDVEIYGITANGNSIALKPAKSGVLNPDFKEIDNGIELISVRAKDSKFLYAISYVFQDTIRSGKLVKKDFNLGARSEVYVGQLNKRPMVFLDGLYLEQNLYNYDSETGVVTLNDDTLNSMDMITVVFEDHELTGEKEINNIDENNNATVGTFTNAVNFTTPLAFVSGVMGTNIFGPSEIEFQESSLIVKNFGPATESPYKVMIVEAENMYLDSGILDSSKAINSIDITTEAGAQYLLFIDGVLVSPRDLNISNGEIFIPDSNAGQQYVLLKIKDKVSTALSFDGKIHNYTISITNEDGSMYNECNNAIVFANGSIIPTLDSIMREEADVNKKGANGEIISYRGTQNQHYKKFNYTTGGYETLDAANIILVNDLIKADYSNGSIMIDTTDIPTGVGTYYAYTFANGIEEPLLKGVRNISAGTDSYSVDMTHNFTSKQGALSVYVDKLLHPFVTEDTSNTGIFNINNNEVTGEAVYIVERPEKDEQISCSREVLTARNRNTDYAGAYTSTISLLPGVVNVYVNGVMIEREAFTIIDEHTIIVHKNIVGNQNNYNPNDETTWNKYLVYSKDKTHEIECLRDDYITIEVRQDYKLRSQTIPVRYKGQTSFYVDGDGIPKSLLQTQDLIKIYIDGIFYTGDYRIDSNAMSITLLDSNLPNILNVDPIAEYFATHPDSHDAYISEHGEAYVSNPKISRITFEWR